jgi:hypothetical protein
MAKEFDCILSFVYYETPTRVSKHYPNGFGHIVKDHMEAQHHHVVIQILEAKFHNETNGLQKKSGHSM